MTPIYAYSTRPDLNQFGFMIPTDDADYSRVMEFAWEVLHSRGQLKQGSDKWLK